MDYAQTLNYLYESLPMFQRQGKSAYKKDLTNTRILCERLGNPQLKFKSIHIAGTNGKGSTAHSLAAICQVAGYKTGLHTSPHLKEFTERIKINGQEVDEDYVVQFVQKYKLLIEEIKPSFFEISVVMAFDHFANEQVDIAVIEVGLGGRLDSTNVILPEVSVITNISKDHTDLLGMDSVSIAREKAGIIKPGIPIVISEYQEEVYPVFEEMAKRNNAHLFVGSWRFQVSTINNQLLVSDAQYPNFRITLQPDLKGEYHALNLPGILMTTRVLQANGWNIKEDHLKEGINRTATLTNFKGRWQQLGQQPLVICDIAHNAGGIAPVMNWINQQKFSRIHIVWGMVKDKDIPAVMQLLPRKATYYFCAAGIPRALPTLQLLEYASNYDLKGVGYDNVNEAIGAARQTAEANDLIFIGGSAFLVAEIDEL